MIVRFARLVKNTVIRVIKDDFLGMAAEMAFYCILAVFPFLIFLATIFGLIGNQHIVDSILRHVAIIAPSNVIPYIHATLNEIIANSTGKILALSLVIGIWIASNSMYVIIKGLNKAYNIEETRPMWFTRLLSILLLFGTMGVIFISTNAIVLGKWILNFLTHYNIILFSEATFISMIRWPITFLALFGIIYMNYLFMPNITKNPKAIALSSIPGTIFFCIAWVVVSWLFGIYLGHFNMYNKFYGTLAVSAICLLWIYYSSLLILIGGELNSRFYNKIKDNKKCLKTII